MTPFSELIVPAAQGPYPAKVEVSADWLQGRTAYGGLTAALCVAAAEGLAPGLPPLRSAQFAFMGPATGTLSITPAVLRQGKSIAFVGVDLAGEAGAAVRGLLSFGAGRASALDRPAPPIPDVPPPEDCPAYFQPGLAPGFAGNFDARLATGARPMTPGAEPTMRIWVRHEDPAARNTLAGLVALADSIPPASIILFPTRGPFSTATWSIDVLGPEPRSESGWWLVETAADTAGDGYSSQAMTVWPQGGRAAILARQTVAVFV